MLKLIKQLREKEGGFTLIELLVVIAILGILAGVVVFAVNGLGDKGQTNACKIDTRTIKTAQEAYFAKTGAYGTMNDLAGVTDPNTKFLDSASTLHGVAVPSATLPAPSYDVIIAAGGAGKCGGAAGAVVNGTTVF